MEKNSDFKFPWRTLTLFLSVGGAVLLTFFLWGEAIDAWTGEAVRRAGENRALVALVLFAVLASDIFLPIPSCLASTLCGCLLGPWLGFAVSFAAMSASAAAGYALGRLCGGWARRLVGENDFKTLERLNRRFGASLLLSLRPVPILAETSVLFAGFAKVPVRKAVLFIGLGNTLVSAVYAALGAWFTAETDCVSWAFLACLAVGGLAFIRRRTT